MEINISELNASLSVASLKDVLQQKQEQILVLQIDIMRNCEKLNGEPKNDIFLIIEEVKRMMNYTNDSFNDLEEYFQDASLTYIHKYFYSINCLLIHTIKVLSKGLKDLEVEIVFQENSKKQKKSENYPHAGIQYYKARGDTQLNGEIQRLYAKVQSQKISVQSVKPSLAVKQLKEIQSCINQLIEQSHEFIKDTNSKEYQQIRDQIMSKFHKSQDLHELFKTHMTNTSKKTFERGMKKIIEELFRQFCERKEQQYLEEQLRREANLRHRGQQTDSSNKQLNKELKEKRAIITKQNKQIEKLQFDVRTLKQQTQNLLEKLKQVTFKYEELLIKKSVQKIEEEKSQEEKQLQNEINNEDAQQKVKKTEYIQLAKINIDSIPQKQKKKTKQKNDLPKQKRLSLKTKDKNNNRESNKIVKLQRSSTFRKLSKQNSSSSEEICDRMKKRSEVEDTIQLQNKIREKLFSHIIKYIQKNIKELFENSETPSLQQIISFLQELQNNQLFIHSFFEKGKSQNQDDNEEQKSHKRKIAVNNMKGRFQRRGSESLRKNSFLKISQIRSANEKQNDKGKNKNKKQNSSPFKKKKLSNFFRNSQKLKSNVQLLSQLETMGKNTHKNPNAHRFSTKVMNEGLKKLQKQKLKTMPKQQNEEITSLKFNEKKTNIFPIFSQIDEQSVILSRKKNVSRRQSAFKKQDNKQNRPSQKAPNLFEQIPMRDKLKMSVRLQLMTNQVKSDRLIKITQFQREKILNEQIKLALSKLYFGFNKDYNKFCLVLGNLTREAISL